MTTPQENWVPLLNQFLGLVNSYNEYWIHIPSTNGALYHYTDLNGLYGILKSQDMWLTHSRYQNDSEEINLGYQVARDVITVRRLTETDPHQEAYLDLLLASLQPESAAAIYISCFCREDNLLSQWRGYGANGSGVCIQFDAQHFDIVAGPDAPPNTMMRLWSVFYKRDTQQNLIHEALRFAYRPELQPIERARLAQYLIEFFIPTFKSQDFQEEKEYRLIFTPNTAYTQPPEFRVGRNMLIPYYRLRSLTRGADQAGFRLPITGITVGPGIHKNLNVESVRALLHQLGYPPGIRVTASETAYRG
jgi:hypothetical protein